VSVPTIALQSAEMQAVAASTERIEAALSVAQRSVDLARERRAALISAAVTGKIDAGVAV
jgi:type I restriction enzyme S subunit